MVGIYILIALFLLSVLLTLVAIILLLFRETSKTSSFVQLIAGLVMGLFSFFAIDIPQPTIYPLDNEMLRTQPIDVSLQSENNLKIYYSIDGADPKGGEEYDHPISLSSSVTVAARTRLLGFFWSDIVKSHYIVNIKEQTVGLGSNILVDSDNNKFVRDYSPGNQNKYGNLEYYGYNSLLCTQDGMYYISTGDAIYKTDDFLKFTYVTDGDTIGNLCVLGDWIYYTSEQAIHRVRTDGEIKTKIHQTNRGVVSMNVYGDSIYFVSNEDGKLYHILYNGQGLSKISDDCVFRFVIVDFYIYYISGEFEPIYETGHSFSPRELKVMDNKGNNVQKISMPQDSSNLAELRPRDILLYDDELYISNMVGLYCYNIMHQKFHSVYTRVVNSLCILDNNAYFVSHDSEDAGDFYSFDLSSHKLRKIASPYNNQQITSWFYPTKHGLIYSHEYSNWYKMGLNGDEISFLDIP